MWLGGAEKVIRGPRKCAFSAAIRLLVQQDDWDWEVWLGGAKRLLGLGDVTRRC